MSNIYTLWVSYKWKSNLWLLNGALRALSRLSGHRLTREEVDTCLTLPESMAILVHHRRHPCRRPRIICSTFTNRTKVCCDTHGQSECFSFNNYHFPGGILVCEVGIQEPFFYTKVYALEMSRLLLAGGGAAYPNLISVASAQAHYTDRFLNECDHVKVSISNQLSIRDSIYFLQFVCNRFCCTCIPSPTISTWGVSTRSCPVASFSWNLASI